MAVLVQRHGFDVNPWQCNIYPPRITYSIRTGLSESVVVINFVQRRIQVVVTIDVCRGTRGRVNKDKGDGKGQDAATTAGPPDCLEESSWQPSSLHDVCQERIAEATKAEKGIEDVRICSAVGSLHEVHFLETSLCLPRV